MSNICIICGEDSRDSIVTLINGEYVHVRCEADLIEDISRYDYELRQLLQKRGDHESNIQILQQSVNTYTRTTLLSRIYEKIHAELSVAQPERVRNLTEAKARLDQAIRARELFNTKYNHIKSTTEKNYASAREFLESIYDYWPGYPPDWDERRDALKAEYGEICQECNYEKNYRDKRKRRRTFHVHHIVPLSKGGSHKIDNLQLLCNKCHQKTHHYDINGDLHKLGIKQISSPFTEKVAIINEAIVSGSSLKFRYVKRSGEVMMREIKPIQITTDNYIHKIQVVVGFCKMRQETRHFTIARMSQLKVC